MVDKSLALELLKAFERASLPDKVIIACSLYLATHPEAQNDKELMKKFEEAWAKSYRVSLNIEEMVDSYREGWADYLEDLHNEEYREIMAFISRVLGEVISKL